MKIEINKIPLEGLTLEEEFTPAALDLETDTISFRGQIRIKAEVSKITNAVRVRLILNTVMRTSCSRCLEEHEADFKKDITLNYPVSYSELFIDLEPDIREEVIIDYPLKPLCKADCKGLCPKCGRNLNEGNCGC